MENDRSCSDINPVAHNGFPFRIFISELMTFAIPKINMRNEHGSHRDSDIISNLYSIGQIKKNISADMAVVAYFQITKTGIVKN
jgi:hypothetical protein